MRRTSIMIVSALAMSIALAATPAIGAPATPQALWDTTDVPPCIADGTGPCFVNDGGGVELGVRFQTSKPIYVVGVRFYRAQAGAWQASLWDGSGSWIASASDSTTDVGWQDAMFAAPQPMDPGATFVASYYAPAGQYAFEWDYFAAGGRTVGPVTALGGAGANGVFTYGPTSSFPTSTFRETNYWVTPLWVPRYDISGFYQPVDMAGVYNTVKGGATVPLKFEVFWGGEEQADVAVVDRFEVDPIACPGGSGVADAIEFTTTGSTSLRYDVIDGQFVQNWKTPKKPGTCYRVSLFTADGSSISANFALS
jgi:hypothetical protein